MKMKKITDLIGKVKVNPPLMFNQFTNLGLAHEGEPWESIRAYMNHELLIYKIMGSIMNGAISSQKRRFLFSKTILIQYFELDPNLKNISLSGTTFKRVLAQLTDPETGFMKNLKPSSTFQSGERRAGEYELIFEPILQFIPEKDVSP